MLLDATKDRSALNFRVNSSKVPKCLTLQKKARAVQEELILQEGEDELFSRHVSPLFWHLAIPPDTAYNNATSE